MLNVKNLCTFIHALASYLPSETPQIPCMDAITSTNPIKPFLSTYQKCYVRKVKEYNDHKIANSNL